MIEAKDYDLESVKHAYGRRARLYNRLVASIEWHYHLIAIDVANIQPGNKVLEVAFGPGLTIAELARRAGKNATIYGVDIAPGMLRLAGLPGLRCHGA